MLIYQLLPEKLPGNKPHLSPRCSLSREQEGGRERAGSPKGRGSVEATHPSYGGGLGSCQVALSAIPWSTRGPCEPLRQGETKSDLCSSKASSVYRREEEGKAGSREASQCSGGREQGPHGKRRIKKEGSVAQDCLGREDDLVSTSGRMAENGDAPARNTGVPEAS